MPTAKKQNNWARLPVEVLFDAMFGRKIQKKAAARLLETLDRWGIRNLRAWPRCRKFRSANVSDKKACACRNWRAAPLRARWSPWKRRWYLKKPSNWSIPSSCSNHWPSC